MTKRSKSRGKSKNNRKRFSRKNKKQKGGDVGCPAGKISVDPSLVPPSDFIDGSNSLYGNNRTRKSNKKTCAEKGPESEECKNKYYNSLMMAVSADLNDDKACDKEGVNLVSLAEDINKKFGKVGNKVPVATKIDYNGNDSFATDLLFSKLKDIADIDSNKFFEVYTNEEKLEEFKNCISDNPFENNKEGFINCFNKLGITWHSNVLNNDILLLEYLIFIGNMMMASMPLENMPNSIISKKTLAGTPAELYKNLDGADKQLKMQNLQTQEDKVNSMINNVWQSASTANRIEQKMFKCQPIPEQWDEYENAWNAYEADQSSENTARLDAAEETIGACPGEDYWGSYYVVGPQCHMNWTSNIDVEKQKKSGITRVMCPRFRSWQEWWQEVQKISETKPQFRNCTEQDAKIFYEAACKGWEKQRKIVWDNMSEEDKNKVLDSIRNGDPTLKPPQKPEGEEGVQRFLAYIDSGILSSPTSEPIAEDEITQEDQIEEIVEPVNSGGILSSVRSWVGFGGSKYVGGRVKRPISEYWQFKGGDKRRIAASSFNMKQSGRDEDKDITDFLDKSYLASQRPTLSFYTSSKLNNFLWAIPSATWDKILPKVANSLGYRGTQVGSSSKRNFWSLIDQDKEGKTHLGVGAKALVSLVHMAPIMTQVGSVIASIAPGVLAPISSPAAVYFTSSTMFQLFASPGPAAVQFLATNIVGWGGNGISLMASYCSAGTFGAASANALASISASASSAAATVGVGVGAATVGVAVAGAVGMYVAYKNRSDIAKYLGTPFGKAGAMTTILFGVSAHVSGKPISQMFVIVTHAMCASAPMIRNKFIGESCSASDIRAGYEALDKKIRLMRYDLVKMSCLRVSTDEIIKTLIDMGYCDSIKIHIDNSVLSSESTSLIEVFFAVLVKGQAETKNVKLQGLIKIVKDILKDKYSPEEIKQFDVNTIKIKVDEKSRRGAWAQTIQSLQNILIQNGRKMHDIHEHTELARKFRAQARGFNGDVIDIIKADSPDRTNFLNYIKQKLGFEPYNQAVLEKFMFNNTNTDNYNEILAGSNVNEYFTFEDKNQTLKNLQPTEKERKINKYFDDVWSPTNKIAPYPSNHTFTDGATKEEKMYKVHNALLTMSNYILDEVTVENEDLDELLIEYFPCGVKRDNNGSNTNKEMKTYFKNKLDSNKKIVKAPTQVPVRYYKSLVDILRKESNDTKTDGDKLKLRSNHFDVLDTTNLSGYMKSFFVSESNSLIYDKIMNDKKIQLDDVFGQPTDDKRSHPNNILDYVKICTEKCSTPYESASSSQDWKNEQTDYAKTCIIGDKPNSPFIWSYLEYIMLHSMFHTHVLSSYKDLLQNDDNTSLERITQCRKDAMHLLKLYLKIPLWVFARSTLTEITGIMIREAKDIQAGTNSLHSKQHNDVEDNPKYIEAVAQLSKHPLASVPLNHVYYIKNKEHENDSKYIEFNQVTNWYVKNTANQNLMIQKTFERPSWQEAIDNVLNSIFTEIYYGWETPEKKLGEEVSVPELVKTDLLQKYRRQLADLVISKYLQSEKSSTAQDTKAVGLDSRYSVKNISNMEDYFFYANDYQTDMKKAGITPTDNYGETPGVSIHEQMLLNIDCFNHLFGIYGVGDSSKTTTKPTSDSLIQKEINIKADKNSKFMQTAGLAVMLTVLYHAHAISSTGDTHDKWFDYMFGKDSAYCKLGLIDCTDGTNPDISEEITEYEAQKDENGNFVYKDGSDGSEVMMVATKRKLTPKEAAMRRQAKAQAVQKAADKMLAAAQAEEKRRGEATQAAKNAKVSTKKDYTSQTDLSLSDDDRVAARTRTNKQELDNYDKESVGGEIGGELESLGQTCLNVNIKITERRKVIFEGANKKEMSLKEFQQMMEARKKWSVFDSQEFQDRESQARQQAFGDTDQPNIQAPGPWRVDPDTAAEGTYSLKPWGKQSFDLSKQDYAVQPEVLDVLDKLKEQRNSGEIDPLLPFTEGGDIYDRYSPRAANDDMDIALFFGKLIDAYENGNLSPKAKAQLKPYLDNETVRGYRSTEPLFNGVYAAREQLIREDACRVLSEKLIQQGRTYQHGRTGLMNQQQQEQQATDEASAERQQKAIADHDNEIVKREQAKAAAAAATVTAQKEATAAAAAAKLAEDAVVAAQNAEKAYNYLGYKKAWAAIKAGFQEAPLGQIGFAYPVKLVNDLLEGEEKQQVEKIKTQGTAIKGDMGTDAAGNDNLEKLQSQAEAATSEAVRGKQRRENSLLSNVDLALSGFSAMNVHKGSVFGSAQTAVTFYYMFKQNQGLWYELKNATYSFDSSSEDVVITVVNKLCNRLVDDFTDVLARIKEADDEMHATVELRAAKLGLQITNLQDHSNLGIVNNIKMRIDKCNEWNRKSNFEKVTNVIDSGTELVNKTTNLAVSCTALGAAAKAGIIGFKNGLDQIKNVYGQSDLDDAAAVAAAANLNKRQESMEKLKAATKKTMDIALNGSDDEEGEKILGINDMKKEVAEVEEWIVLAETNIKNLQDDIDNLNSDDEDKAVSFEVLDGGKVRVIQKNTESTPQSEDEKNKVLKEMEDLLTASKMAINHQKEKQKQIARKLISAEQIYHDNSKDYQKISNSLDDIKIKNIQAASIIGSGISNATKKKELENLISTLGDSQKKAMQINTTSPVTSVLHAGLVGRTVTAAPTQSPTQGQGQAPAVVPASKPGPFGLLGGGPMDSEDNPINKDSNIYYDEKDELLQKNMVTMKQNIIDISTLQFENISENSFEENCLVGGTIMEILYYNMKELGPLSLLEIFGISRETCLQVMNYNDNKINQGLSGAQQVESSQSLSKKQRQKRNKAIKEISMLGSIDEIDSYVESLPDYMKADQTLQDAVEQHKSDINDGFTVVGRKGGKTRKKKNKNRRSRKKSNKRKKRSRRKKRKNKTKKN